MTSEVIPLAEGSGSPDTSAAAHAAAHAAARVIPGRACGTCTLCCKVIAVADFDKLPGVWCPHCVRGKGCGIYETRPTDCRTFFCDWMTEKELGPDWKPEKSKLVMVTGEGGHITAFVDPGVPGAWRQAPYFAALKHLAAEGLRAKPVRIITARIGTRIIVILPDREIDVGSIGPNESLHLERGPNGRIDARKIERPRPG
jgi:hypothetical protein